MKMKLLAVLAGSILIIALPVHAFDTAQQVAVTAVGRLNRELRAKLTESIQKNGPAGSIDVCAREAPKIVSRIEQEMGCSVKRTSLKVRNPRNAPDPEEQQLLETLVSASETGSPLPSGVTAFPNDRRRFYKTIIVEPACLKCHGNATTMSEQVRRAIAAKYPDDKAVSYKEGDFRGIISVTVK